MKHAAPPDGIVACRAARQLVIACQEKIMAWDGRDRERRKQFAELEAAAANFSGDVFTATEAQLLSFAALKIRADLTRPAIGRMAFERDVMVLELRAKAEKLFIAARDIADLTVEAPATVQDNWIRALRDDAEAAATWALDISEKILAAVIPLPPREWTTTGEPLKSWHIEYLKQHAQPAPAN